MAANDSLRNSGSKDNTVVLTAVGPDRIGLVEEISTLVVRLQCNIEDSKMAVFCDEFAVILLVSGSADNLLQLTTHHDELTAQTGLTVWVRKTCRTPLQRSPRYQLHAACMDHPGVVYELSRVLSGLGINIESMETSTYSAPVSGTPMFLLDSTISVPPQIDMEGLRAQLNQIEREQNIDLTLSLEATYPGRW